MNSAAHYFSMGNSLLGQGRAREAEEVYRRALSINPEFAEAHLNLGVGLKSQGRFREAEACYREALRVRPRFVEALNNLANILRAQGRLPEAEAGYRQALEIRPGHLEALVNLSHVLIDQGRLPEAEANCQEALRLRPELVEAHNAMGLLRKAQGRYAAAEACYRRALELKANYAEAANNLGNVLQLQNRPAEAESFYRHALSVHPRYAEAHNNLGNALFEQGRPAEAEASYRAAVQLNPGFADAHGHLGAALKAQGRLSEAEASYRLALQLRPNNVVALNNLAHLLITQGDANAAFQLILQALELGDTPESRLLFMDCVTRLRITHIDERVRKIMIRALKTPWGQANSLARVGSEMVKLGLRDRGIELTEEPWTGSGTGFGTKELAAAASDELLSALLASAPLRDLEMERFLTEARRYLLDSAIDPTSAPPAGNEVLRFSGALAEQCFINEYVHSVTVDEARHVENLRAGLLAELDAGAPVPPTSLLAVAAYFPLHTLADADRLLAQDWPEPVARLMTQQVRQPLLEKSLAADMPSLTGIDDPVSLKVQRQYVENPYPRWISPDIAVAPRSVNTFIRETFPQVPFHPLPPSSCTKVLIAGCGTGYHPISAARRFRDAHVLAIDLSLSSLCYAKRKTRELGLTSIDYAQADILKLGSLGRAFDVVESAGVLHHLRDPAAGLRVLVDLLRPGGFLQLGLYSEIARRDITRARHFIAARGYGSTPDEIRRCRQDLLHLEECAEFRSVTTLSDFFATSTCRDLLFHVQESCANLLDIRQLLHDHGLTFLGLDLDPQLRHAYSLRFPDDPAATDLAHWHEFELEHPEAFIGMYQFWAQKAA